MLLAYKVHFFNVQRGLIILHAINIFFYILAFYANIFTTTFRSIISFAHYLYLFYKQLDAKISDLKLENRSVIKFLSKGYKSPRNDHD